MENLIKIMKESYLEKICSEHAKLYKINSIKLFVPSNVGHPDRVFLLKGGKPIFIEFKVRNEKPTVKQKAVIDEMLEKGYNVRVCNSLDEFKQILRESIR